MNVESLITDLAFILLLGAVVTIIFKWIKQPVVLGYIVAGFLASPNFVYLPSVTSAENIDFWGQIGIVVLLFSLGLEFSFKKLLNSGGSAAVTALIIIAGMMATGFAIGHFMGFTTINCLFLGGMLSMSSTTIIIKAFNDLGLRQKKFTSLVLAVLIVEDLFAVVMMVLLSSIAINKSVEGGELLFSVAKLIFFLVIWFLVGVFVLPSLFNAWRRFLNSETLLIVSMGLCLGMSVFSVYCGFSLALGAFVMGSILSGTSYAERIERVTAPVKDLFGAVFFISVGMMVQPHIIAEYWGPILILSATVVVGMIVFGTTGMLVTGQSLLVAIESGFSLTQIGEFAFIIATLGMSLKVLDPTIYPIVVAVSVLTTFGTPYFIKMAPGFYRFVEKHLPKKLHFLIDRYQDDAVKSNAMHHGWLSMLRHTIGSTLLYTVIVIAIMLASHTYLVPWMSAKFPAWGNVVSTVITLAVMSPFLFALMQPVKADAAELSLPRKERMHASVPRVVLTIFRCLIALGLAVAFITWHHSIGVALAVGIAALLLLLLVFSRKVKARMDSIETIFLDNLNERDLRRSGKNNRVVNDLHLAYMTVGTGCEFAGQRLMDSNLRSLFGVNVVSVQRGAEVIPIPSGKERIYPSDVLGVVGTDAQIEALLPRIEAMKPEVDAPPQDIKITSILLSPSSPLIGRTPVSARLRDDYDVLVVAVQRGSEYIDSNPNLVFQPSDILWVVGSMQNIGRIV